MSDKPQLHHIDSVTTGDPVLPTSATGDDAAASVPTVFPTTPEDSTPSRQTTTSEREEGEGPHTAQAAATAVTATNTTVTPSFTERPPVDEFADPKISALHTIFPDYDAAIL